MRAVAVSLNQFKASPLGALIGPILNSEQMIVRMEIKSASGRPALEAIGKDIEARLGSLDDEQKKLVGRWVKEVLAPRGWRPDRKGRLAAGNFFSRGTIYRRAVPPAASDGGRARLAAAQALVRQLPHPPMRSDELVFERRRRFDAEK
jgi:hypothetical protein